MEHRQVVVANRNRRTRHALVVASVLLAAALVASGCGSDSGSDSTSSGSDSSSSATTTTGAPDPGSQEAAEDRLKGSASFASTPQLAACMERAGFTTDAPPHGGLVAWKTAGGARAVVATDSDAALQVAGMIGTAEQPAQVDGRVVVAGPQKVAKAAANCLGEG